VAQHVDDAGAVAVRNDAWKGDLAREAGARLHVRRIDAGRGEPDAHLAGTGTRRLDLADLKHIAGGSVPFVIPGTHLSLPSLSPQRRVTRRARAGYFHTRRVECGGGTPAIFARCRGAKSTGARRPEETRPCAPSSLPRPRLPPSCRTSL